MKKTFSFLLSSILVLLTLVFFFRSNNQQIQVQADTLGGLLAFDQTYNEDNTSNTQLVSININTGTTAPIGNIIETTIPGSNNVGQSQPDIDTANHRIFYFLRGGDPDNLQYIVRQDTQTGVVDTIFQSPAQETNLITGAGVTYDSSIDKLLAFDQTYNEDNTSNTQLVSFDINTGTSNPVGDPIENTIPGSNNVGFSHPSIDIVGHRIFYFNRNENGTDQWLQVISQDTQTGEVTIVKQFPTTVNFALGAGVTYDSSTDRLLIFDQTFNEDDTTSTQLVSINIDTGDLTSVGDPVETTVPGNNNVGQSHLSIDTVGHRIFYFLRGGDPDNLQYIVKQDTQTGDVNIIFQSPAQETNLITGAGVTYDALLAIPTPQPTTTTFNATADTYIKSGSNNRNTGAGVFMRLQSSGNNRALVKFDQVALQSAIGGRQVLSAKLRIIITDNGNNWGTSGRTIDVHRLITDWSEGNGTEVDRGIGEGATWECAIDSNITNTSKNCNGSSEWEMGQPSNPLVHPWVQTATDTQTITNNQSGVVEFDVTSDVTGFIDEINPNYGWIIKKTEEGQNGMVHFGTRESSSVPQLVIIYQP